MCSDKDYYLKEIIPNISKEVIVLTGDCSLMFNGVSISGSYMPYVLVDDNYLRNMHIYNIVYYCYVDFIDTTHYVTPLYGNPLILVSSIERTIVEVIKYKLEFVEPGSFCDSLERYQHSDKYNRELLEEVATYFKVSMADIDYWLEESIDYNSY